MSAFNKKTVVLTAMVAMVGMAGYFNYMYNNSDNGRVNDTDEMALGETRLVSGNSITEEKDYFVQSRLERDTGRSKAMESLTAVAENPDGDSEVKKDAAMRLVKMSERMESEAAAEGEIKSKGFSDCVVFLSEDTATVVLEADEITSSDAAKVQEIIIRLTGIESSRISISSYK